MSPVLLRVGDSDVEVPDTFATYEIVRQIGVGGFSAVVLVREKATGSEYACKVVTRESLAASGTFARFEQEVRLLEQLRHPNIVPIVECLFEDNFIFVIMEYCSGGELFEFLVKHGRLHEPQCRRLFTDIISAISYIHAHGIAHRDIKPENILLSDSMTAKVGDLGLCKTTNPSKLMTTPCGSPIYAAPEVIGGQGYDGRMCDIWSLGVVLYVMATAIPPWQNLNGVELFKEVSRGEYKVPMYLSPELRALIRAMMNVVPTERPTIDEVANCPWITASDLNETGMRCLRKIPLGDVQRSGGTHVDTARRAVIVRPVSIAPIAIKTAPAARARPGEGTLESLLRKVPPSGRVRVPQQTPVPRSG
jgi:serine/threonine protein kinase